MPGLPITLLVDGDTFAGLAASSYDDGQQVRITADGTGGAEGETYEAVGADGARAWVLVGAAGSVGSLGDVDTTTDPPDDGETLVWDAGSETWVPGGPSVDTLSDADTTTTPPSDGDALVWDATGGGGAGAWVPGAGAGGGGGPDGSGEILTVDTDVGGVFAVTLGTAWQLDADGLARFDPAGTYETGQARFGIDADGLPYLEAV